jgi:integrase
MDPPTLKCPSLSGWTLAEIDQFRSSYAHGTIERTVFEMAFALRLRSSEIFNLRWCDVIGRHLHVFGKTGYRSVILSQELVRLLPARAGSDQYVFWSARDGLQTPNAWFQCKLNAVGIYRSLHSLRVSAPKRDT